MIYPQTRRWTVLLPALLLIGTLQTHAALAANAKTKTPAEIQAERSRDNYNKAINDFNEATRTLDPAKITSTIAELQALTGDPLYQNDPTVHNLLGYLYLTQNDPASAIPELQKTIQLKPDNLDAHNNLGNALRQTNRYDEAAVQYQYVLDHPAKEGPNPDRVKFHLATVLGQSGNLDASLPLFASLTASGSADAAIYKNYGFFLQKAGRTPEAAAALAKSAELNPKDVAVALSAGELYAKAGQTDDAITNLNKALSPDADPKLDAASLYDAHFTLGQSYAAKGDSAAGAKEFAAASALQPQNAAPLYNEGVLLEQQGAVSDAEASYRSALQRDTANTQIQLALGLLLAGEGLHNAEAASLLAQAVPKLPQDAKAAPVYARLGGLYLKQKQSAQANAAWHQALVLAPSDTSLRVALADSYMAQHQYYAALAEYTLAAKSRPTDATLQNQRGVAYKNLRQYPKAMAAFKKAAAFSPKDALVQNNLGVMNELLGRKAAAVAAYKKALKLNPHLFVAYRNLNRFARQ